MMDESYLLMGLNGVCRAHSFDYFADGHRGASVIAAYYLCRENDVQAGVPDAIAGMVGEHWGGSELFSSFPAEPAEEDLVGRITSALARRAGGLRQAGHDVILPSLALRAFRDLPEAATPSRVEGVCRLMEAFARAEETPAEEAEDVPAPAATEKMAAFVLRETLGSIARFDGRGQGWSGHMLTFGRALIDLVQLGYPEAAEGCMGALKRYVARTRLGPQTGDKVYEEHPDTGTHPLQLAYWQRRAGLSVGIGHCFKYPYAFYGLMSLAGDADLERACMGQCYHVF